MAKEFYEVSEKDEYSSFIGFDKLNFSQEYEKKFLTCHGCENVCTITKLKFDKKNVFYTGNKCEKYFSNKGSYINPGESLADYKYDLLFNRKSNSFDQKEGKLTFGIPRALNMFENYPFWHTLLTDLGFGVVLSDKSSMSLYEKGLGTIMADNICFPAKVTHGHILNLVEKKVDRIFYPMVMYEKPEFNRAINTFNCPIVTGYPEVIASAVNPEKKYNIPVDKPVISFKEKKLFKKGTYEYLKQFDVKKRDFDRAFDLAVQEQDSYKYKIKEKSKKIIQKGRDNGEPIIMLVGRPYHIDPLLNHKISQILVDLGLFVITEDSIEITDKSLSQVDVLTQWSYPNRIYHAAEWATLHEDVEVVQLNSFGCGPDAIVTDEIRDILKTADKNLTLIKVDEVSSTGAVKLRLRTLAESLRLKIKKGLKYSDRVTTREFIESDKDKLILIPEISRFYTSNTAKVFESLGYKAEILPTPNKESSEYGMKFANNEICYPSILVVGDIIKALKSGKYDLDKVAVGITQTGGQCRASSYLSLIKKGMVASGYSHIPVVGVATNGTTYNNQLGFDGFDTSKFLKKALIGIMYGDAIAKMYYSTAVREINKGESDKLVEKHIKRFEPVAFNDDIDMLIDFLEDAITDFNHVEVDDNDYPVIGIVGEIFIKYNDYGNRNLVKWLMMQDVEVRVPPLLDFFTQELLNVRFDKKNNIGKVDSTYFLSFLLEHKVNKMINRLDYSMKRFRYYYKDHTVKELAEMGGKIVSLVNQYGEGWLIPAEVSGFMKDGINNIVSLQPFGCIANHVIAKGVEKKLKETFPTLNMLFLDLDPDTSDVNYLNRLHFLIKASKEGSTIPSEITSVDQTTLKAEINI
jgi:predicted nucleotide-binding protein (sugar kinase/HSP70/actin superfamily)